MKKSIGILLVAAMLLCVAGCSLFSKANLVMLGDYTHTDPDGLSYDSRTVLKNADFGKDLAAYASSAAYPDTMIYDDSGNPVGMYDYNAETGLAVGWTDITNGNYTAYNPGEEVNLGKPDASKMVTIPGEVALYFVVYAENGAPAESHDYLILGDASAKDIVLSTVKSIYGMEFTAESDTVLKYVADKSTIAALLAEGGFTDAVTEEDYIGFLQGSFAVREDRGENPYTPYADHRDPTDFEYDQRVVLTGNGQAAVPEDLTDYIASQTDFLYGKNGDMVAAYTYYEGTSKDAADKIATFYTNAQRVSDTTLLVAYTGSEMTAVLDQYKGYNVIKDHSVAEYTRMIEETFYSVVYE